MNYNLNNRSLPSPTFASTSAAYNCVGRGVYLSADDFADAAASCGRQGDVSGGEAVLVIDLDTGSEREGFSICHEPYHICGTGWHITVSQMSVEDGDRQRTGKGQSSGQYDTFRSQF